MSNRYDEWIPVIPAKGKIKETVRALLDLAPDPRDVRSVGNGDEFLVPPELAAAYEATTQPAPEPAKTPRKRVAKKESDG
jgi:hypothetical protein